MEHLTTRVAATAAAVLISAITMVVAVGPGSPVSACSCAELGEMEAFELADAVFVGTLAEVRTDDAAIFSSDDPERFIFDVDDVYKGEIFERQSVVTARDGASCGLEVSGSLPIVVFARSSADGLIQPSELEAGEVTSSLCSGTRVIGSNPLPARFGEPAPPLVGSSGIGGSASGIRLAVVAISATGVASVLAIGGLLVWRRRQL